MRKLKRSLGETTGYLFILPWIIGFLIFTAFPIFYSLYLSFFSVRLTTTGIQTTFLKADNYLEALTGDLDFLKKIMAFLQEIFIAVILIVLLALIISLLLNQKIKGRGFFRTIFFLPVIISSGPVLQKLQDMGIATLPNREKFAIYQFASENPELVFTTLLVYVLDNLVMLLWFSGVQILIFLAALQKVDRSIYEAARVDGASSWESFWKLTLPALTPMILVNVIYTTVIYSVSSLNPIIAHILENMFKMQTGFGYSCALAWIYFVVITVVLLILVGIVRLFSRQTRR